MLQRDFPLIGIVQHRQLSADVQLCHACLMLGLRAHRLGLDIGPVAVRIDLDTRLKKFILCLRLLHVGFGADLRSLYLRRNLRLLRNLFLLGVRQLQRLRVQLLRAKNLAHPSFRRNAERRIHHQLPHLLKELILDRPLDQSTRAMRVNLVIALLVVRNIRIEQQPFVEGFNHPTGDAVIHLITNRTEKLIGVVVLQLHAAEGIRRGIARLPLRHQWNAR